MENSESLTFNPGSFFPPSLCVLTSGQLFKISQVMLEKSLISITKVSKNMNTLKFEQCHRVSCVF